MAFQPFANRRDRAVEDFWKIAALASQLDTTNGHRSNRASISRGRATRDGSLSHLGELSMDQQRFDDLTRTLASRASRRAVLGGLAASTLAALRPRRAAAGPGDPITCNAQTCRSDTCVQRGCVDDGDGGLYCADIEVFPGVVCRAAAGPCDAPEVCTDEGTCPADTLRPAGYSCDYGTDCIRPATCTGSSSDCPEGVPKPDGTRCGYYPGQVCNYGYCQSGCYIDGRFYSPYWRDPSNPCRSCQPYVSTSAWSTTPDGWSCGSGSVCVGGTCQSGCYIDGAHRNADSSNPNNPCQACRPQTSTATWSNLANGSGCNDGGACTTGDTCQDGVCTSGAAVVCTAQDACHEAGACNPADGSCTNPRKPDGTACDEGHICVDGACQQSCRIGGANVAAGTPNPDNPCQACRPNVSTGSWSNVTANTACSTGNACIVGETCQGGACVGGAGRVCPSDNNPCTSTTCDPATGCGHTPVDDGMTCTGTGTCTGGVCNVCPTGQTLCGGVCVNLKKDRRNCGACGKRCPRGKVCRRGRCRPA